MTTKLAVATLVQILALPLLLGSCDVRDDKEAIDLAYKKCLEIANPHLSDTLRAREYQLKRVDNTSDVPQKDEFEFIWRNDDSVIDQTIDETYIWCRGNAGTRMISFLRIGEKNIIENPIGF